MKENDIAKHFALFTTLHHICPFFIFEIRRIDLSIKDRNVKESDLFNCTQAISIRVKPVRLFPGFRLYVASDIYFRIVTDFSFWILIVRRAIRRTRSSAFRSAWACSICGCRFSAGWRRCAITCTPLWRLCRGVTTRQRTWSTACSLGARRCSA